MTDPERFGRRLLERCAVSLVLWLVIGAAWAVWRLIAWLRGL